MFMDDYGREIPVAQMTDADLSHCLQNGFIEDEVSHANVLERLRIEVTIRAWGLRDEARR